MKTALVLGAGGFIGSHLVKRLRKEGYWVRGADLKYPDFSKTEANDFVICDLRDPNNVEVAMRLEMYDDVILNASHLPHPFSVTTSFDEVYQLAADMGGAGYIFTGNHDADVMHNSATINLNVAWESVKQKIKKIFYSSSACIYPEFNQLDPTNPNCEELSAYPANPDSEYGWEKLFSERMYLSFSRNYGINVRIARFHNIFGPEGTWDGGKEKAPAAMCRKAAETEDGGVIEVWGDGLQTRSFLYIDECLEAVRRFMEQDEFIGPVNIGSEEMVTINDLAKMAIHSSGKNIDIVNVSGVEFEKKYGFKCPVGVRGRNSDNRLYKSHMNWEPSLPLNSGLETTYRWIESQIKKR